MKIHWTNEPKEWAVYDSVAYKIMVAMDISMDIDPDFRTYFKSSEHMFENLKSKLQRFEEWDDGTCDWYGNFVEFLEDEERRDDLVHEIVSLRNSWTQEDMKEAGYKNTGEMVEKLSVMPVARLQEIFNITAKVEETK